ncbi:MAG: glycosyltransferase family 2 protein [Deltaproteobacteria bacterium]
MPKVSVVTAVHNSALFIEKCVTSVLDQDYPELEYIIIDGGSTDGTFQIIENFRDHLAYCISERDRGQTHALNKGFAQATGDVFAWINADEQYLPGTLWEVGRAFSSHPRLDFFSGNRIVIDQDLNEIRRKTWVPMHPKWHLLYKSHVLPTDASFWSARAHRMTGELDEKHFPRTGMDIDWLLRLSLNVREWKYTRKYLSKYTERPDRASQKALEKNQDLVAYNHHLAQKMLYARRGFSKVELSLGRLVVNLWERIYCKLGQLGLLRLGEPKQGCKASKG